MKIRKTARQKNVSINLYYYTRNEINEMLKDREITYFDGTYLECYESICDYDFRTMKYNPVIFTEHLKSIDVKCINGEYVNVAEGKNGKLYFVIL